MAAPSALVRRLPARTTRPRGTDAHEPPAVSGQKLGSYPRSRGRRRPGGEVAPPQPRRRPRAPAPVARRGSRPSPGRRRRRGQTPGSSPPPTPAASPRATPAASCARSSSRPPTPGRPPSAPRAPPRRSRSENTRCEAGVQRQRVRQLSRRHVLGEAARQLEPPREVPSWAAPPSATGTTGRCSARGCRPPPSTTARPTTRTPASSPTRGAPPRPGGPGLTGRRG